MRRGVTLVSGGFDSTLVALLLQREEVDQILVFLDYEHRSAKLEWASCNSLTSRFALPAPVKVDMRGMSPWMNSSLTSSELDICDDAFYPCRNLLFAVIGAAIATGNDGSFVAMGLLDESDSLFPDQTASFADTAKAAISTAVGREMDVLLPLFDISKADAIRLGRELGLELDDTYGCHAGTETACGQCISCKERIQARNVLRQLESKGE